MKPSEETIKVTHKNSGIPITGKEFTVGNYKPTDSDAIDAATDQICKNYNYPGNGIVKPVFIGYSNPIKAFYQLLKDIWNGE